ncbi:MAG: hypothetical protein Q9201_002690 [Fulgogasparrea decipioides]
MPTSVPSIFYSDLFHPYVDQKIDYTCDITKMGPMGGPRGFEEVKVFVNAHQPKSDRFGHKEQDTESPPALAKYRNNLVALSQYYNLLFVGARDRVLVYEPQGPDQILTTLKLTIHLASSNSGIHGYIDPTNSHAINQLSVADVGVEEVIVTACDDGDVVAYTTHSICKEIERQQQVLEDVPFNRPCSNLRPFLLRNVNMSAWGVAVHKEARMVAVSSNSAKIHVFAFALTSSGHDNSVEPARGPFGESESTTVPLATSPQKALHTSGSPEWLKIGPSDGDLVPSDRSKNLELTLELHSDNIPNVAFYNPYGPCIGDIFLISTDIDSTSYVWNVWKRQAIAKLNTYQDHRDFRGWGVACIDPNICRNAKSSIELFGVDKVDTTGSPVNITQAANFVPGSSNDHFALRNEHTGASTFVDTETMLEESPLTFDYDDEFDILDESGNESEHNYSDNTETEAHEEDQHEEATVGEELGEAPVGNTIQPPFVEWSGEEWFAGEIPEVDMGEHVHSEHAEISGNGDSLEGAQLDNALDAINNPSDISDQSFFLPFYVLHTNKSNVRLFHSIRADNGSEQPMIESKEVLCRSPLVQNVPDILNSHLRLSRLSMVLQIPELGIVVVGDQYGRVAILTMTRQRRKTDIRDDKVGFRFERFLPLMWEEDAGHRPKTDLLGIAAGPIQGHEFKRADGLSEDANLGKRTRSESWRKYGSRKYRLLMYYNDHTVLSYELSRPRKDWYKIVHFL